METELLKQSLIHDEIVICSVISKRDFCVTKKSLRGAQGLELAPEGLSIPSRQRRLGTTIPKLDMFTGLVGAAHVVDLFYPGT